MKCTICSGALVGFEYAIGICFKCERGSLGDQSLRVNFGHGHVFPRADGVLARCGGPALCEECAGDEIAKNTGSIGPKAALEDINKNKPHYNVKALCLGWNACGEYSSPCSEQWIGTVPVGVNLTKLQCPKCGRQNSFAVPLPRESP